MLNSESKAALRAQSLFSTYSSAHERGGSNKKRLVKIRKIRILNARPPLGPFSIKATLKTSHEKGPPFVDHQCTQSRESKLYITMGPIFTRCTSVPMYIQPAFTSR